VLAMSRDRAWRRAGLGAAVLAAAAMWIGSPWFLLGVVRDPLAVEMPALSDEYIAMTMTERREVDGTCDSIALAPEGDAVLLTADDDDDDGSDEPRPRHYSVSGVDRASRSFYASAAALVDHNRVLLLDREPGR